MRATAWVAPRPVAAVHATALERYALMLMLIVMFALPLLVGSQPRYTVSAEETGILSEQGDAAKQLVLGLLYVLCAGLLLWRTRPSMWQCLGLFIGLTLLWCFASAAWSDLPMVSLRRSAALSGAVLVGLYAGLRFGLHDMMRLFARVVGIVILASLALAVLKPELGLDPEMRLRGVFEHKNVLGRFAAVGLFTFALLAMEPADRRARTFGWMAAAGCLAGLALSSSATPWPSLVFALVIAMCALRGTPSATTTLVVLLLTATAAGMALPAVATSLGEWTSFFGRDADFSGRTFVWHFALELLQRNPWGGYGFGTFWNGPAGTLFMSWAGFPIAHAHNGYLQLALDAGIVSVVLLLAALAALVRGALRLLGGAERVGAAWILALVAFQLFSNQAEALLFGANDVMTILIVYSIVRVNALNRLTQERPVQAASRGFHAFRKAGHVHAQ